MKTYYLTLSKVFPSTHAKAGMNTCFEEKLRVYKLHTVRRMELVYATRVTAMPAFMAVLMWIGIIRTN